MNMNPPMMGKPWSEEELVAIRHLAHQKRITIPEACVRSGRSYTAFRIADNRLHQGAYEKPKASEPVETETRRCLHCRRPFVTAKRHGNFLCGNKSCNFCMELSDGGIDEVIAHVNFR